MLRTALPVAIAAIFSTAAFAVDLSTDAQKAAYAIGYQFGANAKRDGLPLDTSTLAPVAAGTSPALRSGQAGHPIAAWIDTAATVESSLNSGKWRVDLGALTTDGAHPNATGHGLVAAALTVTAAS